MGKFLSLFAEWMFYGWFLFLCAHFCFRKTENFSMNHREKQLQYDKGFSQCNCYLLLWSVVLLKINPEVKFKSQRGNVLTLLTLTESVISMSFASR